MYFKTERNSETGKKFQEFADKKKLALNAQVVFAEKYGIKQWRDKGWYVGGQFYSVIFKDDVEVDLKVWKEVKGLPNEYMPRLNSKKGKEIQKEIDEMPLVSKAELNSCIGWDEDFSKSIGYARSKEYFGFEVDEKWEVKIPKDCIEVTTTEYKKLFR